MVAVEVCFSFQLHSCILFLEWPSTIFLYIMLRFSLFLLTILVTPSLSSSCQGCTSLSRGFPDKVFSPGSTVYAYENGEFWSNTELLSPACIFRPSSALDVSGGIKTLAKVNSSFAVRGGGHMGIKV